MRRASCVILRGGLFVNHEGARYVDLEVVADAACVVDTRNAKDDSTNVDGAERGGYRVRVFEKNTHACSDCVL